MPGTLISFKELTKAKGSAEYGEDGYYDRFFRAVYHPLPDDLDEVYLLAGLPTIDSALKVGDARLCQKIRVLNLDDGMGYVIQAT